MIPINEANQFYHKREIRLRVILSVRIDGRPENSCQRELLESLYKISTHIQHDSNSQWPKEDLPVLLRACKQATIGVKNFGIKPFPKSLFLKIMRHKMDN